LLGETNGGFGDCLFAKRLRIPRRCWDHDGRWPRWLRWPRAGGAAPVEDDELLELELLDDDELLDDELDELELLDDDDGGCCRRGRRRHFSPSHKHLTNTSSAKRLESGKKEAAIEAAQAEGKKQKVE